jgi:hypothetical protein
MKKTIELEKGDHIVTAWAEHAAGPGWANHPVWVLIRSATGSLRIECLQPNEQPVNMRVLYGVSAQAHQSMVRAAESVASVRR